MAVLVDKIFRYDAIISYRLSDLRSRQWLRLLMMFSSKLGDGPLWTAVSLLVLAFGGAAGRRVVLLVAASTVISVAVFKAIKNATSRRRPFETYPDLIIEFTLPPPDKFSFPSGHSMSAFAISTVVGHYFPMLSVPLFTMAFLIAASRVFLALHYPTDCVAGASVGVVIAAALVRFAG